MIADKPERDGSVGPPAAGGSPADERLSHAIKRIARNTIYLNIGQFFAKIVSFAYILVLVRWLSLDDFGRFSLVLAFILITDIAADCGLARLIIRDLARDRSRIAKYLGVLVPVKATFAVLGWVVATIAVWLGGYSIEMVELTAIAGLGLLPSGLATAFDNTLHARQRMGISAVAAIALSLAQAVLGIAVLVMGGSLRLVLVANVIANVVHMAVLYYGVRRQRYRFRMHIDVPISVRMIRTALPYAGIAVLTILSARAEILALSWFGTSEDIGLYSVAAKFAEAAIFFPLMFAAALTPVVSKLHVESYKDLNLVYLWAVRVLLLVVLPGSMCVVALAGPIVDLLLPDRYAASTLVLQVLFVAFPFAAIHAINAAILFASDHLKQTLWIFLGLACTQFALNFVLIPSFGLKGAVMAYFLTQVAASIVSSSFVRVWFLPSGGVLWNLVQPGLGGAAMFGVVWFYLDQLGPWVTVPGLAAFGLVALLLMPRFPLMMNLKVEETD